MSLDDYSIILLHLMSGYPIVISHIFLSRFEIKKYHSHGLFPSDTLYGYMQAITTGKKNHLYQFVTLICTRYWTGIGSLVMMERICIGRDIRYKCLTFAMGGVLTWYKCALSPLMWQGAFVPRGGTTRNKYSFLFSFMFVFFYVCLL
jgi:hypothetical protein